LVLSPQGHVEHAAAVVDDGSTTWLVTERSHAADLAAWLDRMKFMLRVEIADATDDWAVLGEPVDAEGAEGEPVTWRDPWPRVTGGGTRYGPPEDEHPGRERPWRLVLVPRDQLADAVAAREAAGWRLVGTWASEAARVEAWRPREGDHRARAQPRPSAAADRQAAPGRLRAPAAGGRRRGDARRPRRGDRDVGRAPPRARAHRARRAQAERARGRGAARRLR